MTGNELFHESLPRILMRSSFCYFFNKLSIFMGIFIWCVKYFLPYQGGMHNFMFSWWLRVIVVHINCMAPGEVTIWGDICLQMLCLLNSWGFCCCCCLFAFWYLLFIIILCLLQFWLAPFCQAVRYHFLLFFDIPPIQSCPLLIFCFEPVLD